MGWTLSTRWGDIAPQPWANGLGETTELVGYAESVDLVPEGPRWRLSIATLRSPAEFSPLQGVDRVFAPSRDVVLEINGARVEVSGGSSHRFRGEDDVALVGLSQPCHAINLMVESDPEGGPALVDLQPLTRARGARLAAVQAAGSEPEGGGIDLYLPSAGSEVLDDSAQVVVLHTC